MSFFRALAAAVLASVVPLHLSLAAASLSACAGSEIDRRLNEHSARDTYANFAELARAQKRDVDYRIVTVDRKSAITALAIHGGKIERGTSELAREVAGQDYNLYLFEGIKPEHNFVLHITSRNFDEPEGTSLLSRSEFGLSMHGFSDKEHPGLMMIRAGGDSSELRAAFIDEVAKSGLGIVIPAIEDRFPAPEEDNIVNRTSRGGLQVEMSEPVRDKVLKDPEFRSRLAQAVRRAVERVRLREPSSSSK